MQKIDENFNPIDIHPVSVDHLSIIFQTSSSIASQLNQLGKLEEQSTNATHPNATTTSMQQSNALTSRPCHLHLSSETPNINTASLSSNNHHCSRLVEQRAGEKPEAAKQSIDSTKLNLVGEERRDHPQLRDLDSLDAYDVQPTDLNNMVAPRQHRCSCVAMESTGSTHQMYGCHLRHSSVSTLESERMHFDLTGSGLTDTSGYIMCFSIHDHLEDIEQTST